MDLKINQQMAALSRINLIILILIFSLTVDGQDLKRCIQLKQDVCKKQYTYGDTLKFSFVNIAGDTLNYDLEVMVYVRHTKSWEFSPFYTKYFNYELTYDKMQQMFSTTLPVTSNPNYMQDSKQLSPKEIAINHFVVKDSAKSKALIRFRVNANYGIMDDCKLVYSKPFYFVRIKGDDTGR